VRAMVEGVLAYARAGRTRSAPARLDLPALVHEVMELIETTVVVRLHVPEDARWITGERAPLRQVLLNLLANAVRYAAEAPEPEVAVSACVVDDFVEVSVSDNGVGIPAHLQARIWGLFRRLDPDRHPQGTGIGLAVVKRLVEAQAGRVWVDSDEGAGATFRFLWPRQARWTTGDS
jgi:signal transduction histidine kinase